MAEMSKDWRVIAEQASRERNSEKLIKLAARVVDLLQEEQNHKQFPYETLEDVTSNTTGSKGPFQ